ncbi:MAG TPA: acyl-CoA dehydrogenase [Stellaceae bacterium]|jgi:alkylation response protein AidB-like acyl-CoA dehydrogenase|nr:acyl-CoA dehydrogenase [Stellaceae bacterium]
MPYAAPLAEMRFVMDTVAGLEQGDAADLADAILEEAGKFATVELDPLNQPGDRVGSVLENGVVRTPPGFRAAYRRYVEGGWMGLASHPEYGGQGLPVPLATAVVEMLNSACMAWALCPLLNFGAIEMLQLHGSTAQKEQYLRKLVSGEWAGTMNLTEPQAGSDLGALRTRAMPSRDARWGEHYRVSGQKMFISYGDHDLSDNIIHMVLARTSDAPPGSRGISLFLVPKFLPDGDGKPGERNDVRVLSLEEKLGIHASPTCVMAYGDSGEGAVGWRIGEENRGLEYMFTMMNSERLLVGLQGVAIGERAYQQARDYARARVQGFPVGAVRSALGGAPPPIIQHPDVRRMLLSMRSAIEAMRAVTYLAAAAIDESRRAPEGEARFRAERRADLLIPVVKAWCTDLGVEVASTGVQVHGGMGYVEETGAAQYFRDARIAPIYEGTNGIQANDLVGRKLSRDKGEAARELFAEMGATLTEIGGKAEWQVLHRGLAEGLDAVECATAWLVAADPAVAAAGSAPYLALFGTVAGGWLMTRLALAARRRDAAFAAAKRTTALFYAEHYLPRAPSYLPAIMGGATVLGLDTDLF